VKFLYGKFIELASRKSSVIYTILVCVSKKMWDTDDVQIKYIDNKHLQFMNDKKDLLMAHKSVL